MYEQWWEQVGKILRRTDPMVADHQGKGIEAMNKLHAAKKGWMFPYFDENGRMQIEVPGTIEEDDLDGAFGEGRRIAHKLSQNPKYAPVLLLDHGRVAFDFLRHFLDTKVSQAEWIENKLIEKKPDPSRPDKSLPKGTKVTRYVTLELQYNNGLGVRDEYGADNIPLVIDFINDIYSQMIAIMKHNTDYVVLSINPLDMILAANHSASNWGSCQHIYNESGQTDGAHKFGLLSYLNDGHSAVAFAYRQSSKVYGQDFEAPLKLWRQMIFLDPERLGSFFGREYPSHNPAYSRAARGLAATILAKYGTVDYKWKVKALYNVPFKSDSDTEMDYYLDSQTIRTGLRNNGYHYGSDPATAAIRMYPSGSYPQITVGAPEVPCAICGEMRDDKTTKRSICWRCHPREHCHECGTKVGSDKFEPETNKVFCRPCFDKIYFRCSCCDSYRKREDAKEVAGGKIVCRDCSNRYYRPCSACGKLHKKEETSVIEGQVFCNTCRKDLVRHCDKCGKMFLRDRTEHLVTADGYILCPNCVGTMSHCKTCGTEFLYDYAMINGMCGQCANKKAYIDEGRVEVAIV